MCVVGAYLQTCMHMLATCATVVALEAILGDAKRHISDGTSAGLRRQVAVRHSGSKQREFEQHVQTDV